MHYIVGIAIGDNLSGRTAITAVTCPSSTTKYFGYRRLSPETIQRCASCCVTLWAPDTVRGIIAAYQRSLEKLLIKTYFHGQCMPEAAAYILKPFSHKAITIPHTVLKDHWTISVAEELLLNLERP